MFLESPQAHYCAGLSALAVLAVARFARPGRAKAAQRVVVRFA
ncbi:MAG TPA: hypothetical protein VN325_21905 [Steroidobacteraceae bacterium]|nr:hypothetical protein [Steroidobacteraceae bacterium]